MPLGSRHTFQLDHQKTQELLARYVEIQQTAGRADLMYPDVAAHLEVCENCRSLFEDLNMPPAGAGIGSPESRSIVMSQLASGLPDRDAVAQPPLNLVFREEVILRLEHALSALGGSAERDGKPDNRPAVPAAGYLLFYDTVSVGKQDLVVIFTLHPGGGPGRGRIEGIVSPEQPALRLKARLAHPDGILDAEVEANRLSFEGIPLEPAVSRVVVTLEGYTRWRPGRQPARKSSGTRSGV